MIIELTQVELEELIRTLELVLEEFEGIEAYKHDLENYVLTTGAKEAVEISLYNLNKYLEEINFESFDFDDVS